MKYTPILLRRGQMKYGIQRAHYHCGMVLKYNNNNNNNMYIGSNLCQTRVAEAVSSVVERYGICRLRSRETIATTCNSYAKVYQISHFDVSINLRRYRSK